MKRFVRSLVALLAVCAVPAYADFITIEDSFADNLGGWTAINNSGWEYVSTGGPSGGGYGLWTDLGSGRGTIVAPDSFLNNVTDAIFNGSTLSFDMKVIDFGSQIDRYFPIEVFLFANGKKYTYTAVTAAEVKSWNTTWNSKGQEMPWTAIDIPMTAADWNVGAAEWAFILDNLTGFQITMEVAVNMSTNSKTWDKVGIGNVTLTSIHEDFTKKPRVPEPATMVLLSVGGLALLRRRDK